jgi:hypothetical protein
VSDPDRILSEFEFGRAHHRVLHFVDRQPGLTIAELLDILRITKQSLNRVLKELIEKAFIESRTGTSDRRQRSSTPPPKARPRPEARRTPERPDRARARRPPPGGEEAVSRYLMSMIDADDREHVARLLAGGERA